MSKNVWWPRIIMTRADRPFPNRGEEATRFQRWRRPRSQRRRFPRFALVVKGDGEGEEFAVVSRRMSRRTRCSRVLLMKDADAR